MEEYFRISVSVPEFALQMLFHFSKNLPEALELENHVQPCNTDGFWRLLERHDCL